MQTAVVRTLHSTDSKQFEAELFIIQNADVYFPFNSRETTVSYIQLKSK